jgi:allantoicase
MKLGVGSGIAMGCEVDTAFFNGNHAPEVSVYGTFAPYSKGVPTTEVLDRLSQSNCSGK